MDERPLDIEPDRRTGSTHEQAKPHAGWPDLGSRDGTRRRHMSGVTVRDTRNDANSENEMVKVRGMKRSFDCPSRKIVGRKTTIVVIVETKIGIATLAIRRPARRRAGPCRAWRGDG